MADSLILKGVKDVRRHTGDEMKLVNPKRGGNVHQLKRWWQKGVSTVYVGCTVFDVTTTGGNVKLALATAKGESSQVRIAHDGSGKFTFSQISELERAALFTADFQLIEHYIFPAIAGGSIVTVTPSDGAPNPGELVLAPITGATINGADTAVAGVTEDYTYSATGAMNQTHTWSVTNGTLNSSATAGTASVDWNEGNGQISVTIRADGDELWDGNPVTVSKSVTATQSFAQRVANADVSVAVTVVDNGGNKYYIDGVEQAEITANAQQTIHFDLSDSSLSGHPLKIYTDSSKTTEVTVGIEEQGTDLLFTPPISGNFSYQCSSHAGMGGDITVS